MESSNPTFLVALKAGGLLLVAEVEAESEGAAMTKALKAAPCCEGLSVKMIQAPATIPAAEQAE